VVGYSDVQAAKQWWTKTFNCKATPVPDDWDNSLPSDVALKFPGDSDPTVLLSDKAEALHCGFDRSNPVVTIIFSDKLKKAHEYISARGVITGPIQDGGDTQFFEIRDTEGNLIQVCRET
jgi:hypothetical protein